MAELLEIREYLRGIYSRFDLYIEPILKFILSVVALMLIDMNIGYMDRLQNPAIVLIAALVCSFMPVNVLVVIASVFCVLHAWALSLECAVLMGAVFLLMLLVYFRFVPSDSLVVILTPVCFAMKIPYVIPLVCGLVLTPLSVVSAGFGVVIYYLVDFLKVNESVIGSMEEESTVVKFRYLVDGMLSNKAMVVMLAAFAVTIVLVYLIRRLSVDHSWTVALIVGFFVNVILVLVGFMTVSVEVSIAGVIIGALVSLAIAVVVKFFIFSVDYTRTEMLQFEDDEYYYYVKAVPKMTVAVPEKKVKHINQKKTAEDYPVFNPARLDDQAEDKGVAARGYSSRKPESEIRIRRPGQGNPSAAPSSEDDVKIRQSSRGYRRPVRSSQGTERKATGSTAEMNNLRRSNASSAAGRSNGRPRPSGDMRPRPSSAREGGERHRPSGDRVVRRRPEGGSNGERQ